MVDDAQRLGAVPITFGDFDRWNARWSPDGRRIAYISNENGNTSLRRSRLRRRGETDDVSGKRAGT